jgi:hypothetical protein
MLKAIDAPLVDQVAERKRIQMLQAGMIPPEQMTDEEQQQQQQMQQQAQNQPPSPEQMIGQAELMKAQTDKENATFDQQERVAKHELAMQELSLKGEKLQQERQLMMFNAQNKQETSEYANAKTVSDIQNKNADTAVKMSTAALNAQELEDKQIAEMIERMPTEQLVRMLG